jgi:hypothetical protein
LKALIAYRPVPRNNKIIRSRIGRVNVHKCMRGRKKETV